MIKAKSGFLEKIYYAQTRVIKFNNMKWHQIPIWLNIACNWLSTKISTWKSHLQKHFYNKWTLTH